MNGHSHRMGAGTDSPAVAAKEATADDTSDAGAEETVHEEL